MHDLYQNGVHCVLYDEQNLEQVIEHYLAYEEQRERIVETAWQYVQNYCYAEQYNRLIQQATEAVPEGTIGRARTFSQLGEAEQTRAQVHQRIQSSFAERVEAAFAILNGYSSVESDPILLNDEAVLCLMLASESTDPSRQAEYLQRAEQRLGQAMALEPTHAVAMMNYALLLYATGRHTEMEGWAHRALKALPECPHVLLCHALPGRRAMTGSVWRASAPLRKRVMTLQPLRTGCGASTRRSCASFWANSTPAVRRYTPPSICTSEPLSCIPSWHSRLPRCSAD